MKLREIFDKYEQIGCCTFATIDGDYPETRIAHFLACDEEGLYFMTMTTKPFYKQLTRTGKVSVCGLAADSVVKKKEDGSLKFDVGYFIRMTGDVREVSMEEIKAKNNPDFAYCIEDHERYPAMTTFVIYRAKGEIFDYDFGKELRNHKLERKRFSYGGFPYEEAGLTITDKCTGCGKCQKVCTFNAIYCDGKRYRVDGNRCDECGDCYIYCPVHAITSKGQ